MALSALLVPFTVRMAGIEVVPMPTYPVSPATVRMEAPVELAMWKIGLVREAVPWREKRPHGVDVPIPMFPPKNVAAGPVPLCVTAKVGIDAVEEAKSPPWNHAGVVEAMVVVP